MTPIVLWTRRDYRDYVADVEHCNRMRREDNALFGWAEPLPMLKPVGFLAWVWGRR